MAIVVPVVMIVVAVSAMPTDSAAVQPSTPTTYYASIVPRGPYPAPGYIASAYLPQYHSYRVVNPLLYQPRKPKYEEDQRYKDEEAKYYYGGKFKGVCSYDGLYYMDESSYVVCSNGYASYQPCPPGTKTDSFPSYQAGYYYGSSDLCSVNLVNFGYGPYSYRPPVMSYDNDATNSHEKKPTASYGPNEHATYEAPKKDTYKPAESSYDSPRDPHSTSYDNSAGSTYHTSYSNIPQGSYDAVDHSPQNTYVVDKPHGYSVYSSGSYSAPSAAGSYPPIKDTYGSGADHKQPTDTYKPASHDTYANLDQGGYFEPLPPQHSYASKKADQ